MKRDSNRPPYEGRPSGKRREDKIYLNANQVRRRYGGITPMTLHRWVRRKKMRFPQPEYINRLRYWDEARLDAWDRMRTRVDDPVFDESDALDAADSDPTADAQ